MTTLPPGKKIELEWSSSALVEAIVEAKKNRPTKAVPDGLHNFVIVYLAEGKQKLDWIL